MMYLFMFNYSNFFSFFIFLAYKMITVTLLTSWNRKKEIKSAQLHFSSILELNSQMQEKNWCR